MDESIKKSLLHIYEHKYRQLLWIPFIMLGISLLIIAFYGFTTGEVIPRDVSLKGGVILTVPIDKEVDTHGIQNSLLQKFPGHDVTLRVLRKIGKPVALSIEAGID
ncbi:MAG: hypothetical protein AABX34_05395, partial [Nanoarchaeota archaeon]